MIYRQQISHSGKEFSEITISDTTVKEFKTNVKKMFDLREKQLVVINQNDIKFWKKIQNQIKIDLKYILSSFINSVIHTAFNKCYTAGGYILVLQIKKFVDRLEHF